MNKLNNALENIKDDIREELNNLKKEKVEKQQNNYFKLLKHKNNNRGQTSKEILAEYFNKIKQSSKLNISHNSILSSKNNFENNSLEISGISNFNMDELKYKNNDDNDENNNKINNNNCLNKKIFDENEKNTNKIYRNYMESKNSKI